MEYVLVNIGYLLELLMIQVYIEIIWKQRICFNRFSCALYIINGIVITGINIGILPKIVALLIHIILFLYLLIKNKRGLKENIAKYCLLFILAWITEMLSGVIIYYAASGIKDDRIELIAINALGLIIAILLAFITAKKGKSAHIEIDYKEFLRVALICFVPICVLVVAYAFNHTIYIWYSIFVAIIGIVLIIYLVKVQKTEYKIKQKDLEIEINKTYGQIYEDIINNIRRKQHNFDNQIAALYSMHKTAKTIEELAELQSNYYAAITADNEYEYILAACNEPVLASFLYSKCISCKDQEVSVDCEVHIDSWLAEVLMHELVELLGVLIDNAKEEVLKSDFSDKKISITVNEFVDKYSIIVSNRIDDDSSVELNKIFDTGYSTKGTYRGLGLSRVKQICDKYGLVVQVSFVSNPERNIVFTIGVPK